MAAEISTSIAFISGPIDASDEYFQEHYVPCIETAIQAGNTFVIGPVMGVDAMALQYLLDHNVPPGNITVYMAHFEYQNSSHRAHFEQTGVNVKEVGDLGTTTRDRDAEMTAASTYDILRYRTEEEAKKLYGAGWWPRVSNTEMNERRRKGIKSQAYKLDEALPAQISGEASDDTVGNKSRRVIHKMLGRR
ncbi:hypothetical protein BDV96DRAFT_650466 [Lophiotrema nucula]|uniref:Uncharacterized protein n=1 Tax=Lophiotrema nucula TaxID=690887 RepID=A0A6A5YVD9_9PLEO|nr:hypothetical protein BDV96DRAFT_650466 [Lophiotrema nucula]